MFFKKEITREPELFEFEYQNKELKNKYIIEASDIMTAYNNACALTQAETKGFDSIEIQLKKDIYEITEPLVFDKKPANGLPIIFTSENALISGGKRFKGGFENCGNGIYKRGLPDITGFRQLYANGELCVRSSFPKRSGNYKNEFIESKWLEKERAVEFPLVLPFNHNLSDIEIIAVEK